MKKGGKGIQVEVDVNYKSDYESNYWRGILDAQVGHTRSGYRGSPLNEGTSHILPRIEGQSHTQKRPILIRVQR